MAVRIYTYIRGRVDRDGVRDNLKYDYLDVSEAGEYGEMLLSFETETDEDNWVTASLSIKDAKALICELQSHVDEAERNFIKRQEKISNYSRNKKK